MRLRHATVLTSLLLVGFAAYCVLWLRAEQRQNILNRQLIAALVHRDDKKALALVNAGADPNTHYAPVPVPSLLEFMKCLLHRSPPAGNSPTAFLIACGTEWNEEDATSQVQFHRPDNVPLLRAMLRHGAKVDTKDAHTLTPLLRAILCSGNPAPVVAVLLDYGANPNLSDSDGDMPLAMATSLIEPGAVSLLLRYGADVNRSDKEGNTPLMITLQNGMKATLRGPTERYLSGISMSSVATIVRLLLEHGANVNAKNQDGQTALMCVPFKDVNVVHLLLGYGADVTAKDNQGCTALFNAVPDTPSSEDDSATKEIVQQLVAHGADVNAKTQRGWTVLSEAVSSKDRSLVHLLLGYGADVNSVIDEDRHTVLYDAVSAAASSKDDNAANNIIQQLLAHGADPNLAGKGGDTPLKLAQRIGNPNVIALFRQAFPKDIGKRQ